MTRLQFEKEVYQIMGLLDPSGTVTADTATRTYVQNKIQSAFNGLYAKAKAQFRRKSFSALIQAPYTTGSLTWVQYANTATAVGFSPDNSWVGGHIVIANNGFPLQVASVSGATITFVEYIQAASGTAAAYTMYFDGVLFPTDCQSIEEKTMKLSGKSFLIALSKKELERRQGYYGLDGDDYGMGGPIARGGGNVIGTAEVGQPTVYTTWARVTLSSVVRSIINVYPFPNAAYTLQWDGFKKPTAMTADGDVPDMPEQFHECVLLPRVKLDMCEFPGFELTAKEQKTLQDIFDENYLNFTDDDNQDPGGEPNWAPSSMCR